MTAAFFTSRRRCGVVFGLIMVSTLTVAVRHGAQIKEEYVTPDQWNCLSDTGFDAGIVRIWKGDGTRDLNAPDNIQNAWTGGMAAVDAYAEPCYHCRDPERQIEHMLRFLTDRGLDLSGQPGNSFGRLWLEVLDPALFSGDPAQNVLFLQAMVSAATGLGVSVGFQSNPTAWTQLTDDTIVFSNRLFPLFFADHEVWWVSDGVPDDAIDTSGFVPFGGWIETTYKTYKEAQTTCTVNLDKAARPGTSLSGSPGAPVGGGTQVGLA